MDTVEGALQNPRTNPNMQDKSLYTALVWAATYGHLSVVKTLLADERVDVSFRETKLTIYGYPHIFTPIPSSSTPRRI